MNWPPDLERDLRRAGEWSMRLACAAGLVALFTLAALAWGWWGPR